MSTLRRKLETGIVAYIGTLTATALDKYSVFESSIAQKRELPGVVVKASGETEHFPGEAPRRVKLEIVMLTQLDDAETGEVPTDDTREEIRESHDGALAAIEAALEAPGAPAALRTFLNNGAATKRPVSDFHFYDLTKTDEQPMGDGRQYADVLTFEVVCQNCNG